MIPLTENPRIVIEINPEGRVSAVATNVAQDLNVTVVQSAAAFRDAAAGTPFRSDVPETLSAFTVNTTVG